MAIRSRALPSVCFASFAASMLVASNASAQNASGFSAQRFNPSEKRAAAVANNRRVEFHIEDGAK